MPDTVCLPLIRFVRVRPWKGCAWQTCRTKITMLQCRRAAPKVSPGCRLMIPQRKLLSQTMLLPPFSKANAQSKQARGRRVHLKVNTTLNTAQKLLSVRVPQSLKLDSTKPRGAPSSHRCSTQANAQSKQASGRGVHPKANTGMNTAQKLINDRFPQVLNFLL